jgi:plasmid stability protein
MAILQVRDVDDGLYRSLKEIAKKENRSLSQEVISILEKYLANPRLFKGSPTRDFIDLAASWEDERTADEIIKDIRKRRTFIRGEKLSDLPPRRRDTENIFDKMTNI